MKSGQESRTGIGKASVLRAGREIVASDLGGETILIDLKSSMYYSMNALAGRIWSMLQEPLSAGEIQRRLLEEFEADTDESWRDIRELLQQMAEHGIVEIDHAMAD